MSCSSCSDATSNVMSVKQAQIGAQVAMKAAKIVMDTQKDQGAQVVEQLMKAAAEQQQAMVDAFGRLDATA